MLHLHVLAALGVCLCERCALVCLCVQRARPCRRAPQAQAVPGAGRHRPRPARLHRPQAGHEAGEEGDTMGLVPPRPHTRILE